MHVRLGEGALSVCECVARRQIRFSETHGLAKSSNSRPPNERYLLGALGEMVIARALGIEFEIRVGYDNGVDVDGWQVRTTDFSDGCLILHPYDPNDVECVLVVRESRLDFRIAGTINSTDGKREEFWRDDVRKPAFFVPQSKLSDW